MLLQGGNAAVNGTTPPDMPLICFDETSDSQCFVVKWDSMEAKKLTGVKRQGNTTMCASYAALAVAEGVAKITCEFAHGMLMTCLSSIQFVANSTNLPASKD